MGRRERKKQDTRATLMRAGRALFAGRGVHATHVEDITERVDLGKGAFYNYFESKQALVAALIDEGVEILRRDYLRAVASAHEIKLRIDAMVSAHIAFFEEHPDYAKVFHQARGLVELQPDESARVLEKSFARYLEAMGEALVPAPGGEVALTEGDLLDLAAAVAGAIAGYRSFRVVSGQKPDTRTLAGLLSDGLSPLVAARHGDPRDAS